MNRNLCTAAGLLLAASAGCALTAPMPGGALRQSAFLQVQPTWALSYAQATVNAHGPEGQTTFSGNDQNLSGDESLALLGAVIPVSASLRQSLGPSVDVAVNAGFFDAGVELRVGAPDRDSDHPWALSASARSGQFGLLGLQRDAYQLRARLEAYPPTNEEAPGTRLILSIGLAYGSFPHDIPLPREPDFQTSEVPSAPPHLFFLRPETRLELVVGIERRSPRGSFKVALAPWFVVGNGAPRPVNSDWIIDTFTETFGVSLLFSVGGGGDLLGRDPAPNTYPAFSR